MLNYENISLIIQSGTRELNTLFMGNEFAVGAVVAVLTGVLYQVMKTLPEFIYRMSVKHLTTSMTLNSTTKSYHQLMELFYKSGISSKSRSIKLSNGMWGEADTVKDLGYGSHLFWYKGFPVLVNVNRETEGGVSNRLTEVMSIYKLGRSHNLFNLLIGEIKDSMVSPNHTTYFRQTKYREFIGQQPKRQLDKIFIDTQVKETLLNSIQKFVSKEEWYLENNIPYQLGILLYGKPGTGKTSLVKAIAAYMGREIVIVNDIDGLIVGCETATNAILCVEEIDTFGMSKRSEDTLEEIVENSSYGLPVKKDNDSIFEDYMGERALGMVLQALDGIISNHGRIVVMTTNHRDRLDDALIRPGRIDLQLEFNYFTEEVFIAMMHNFYDNDQVNEVFKVFKIIDNVTGAKVQSDIVLEKTIQEMYDKYNSFS